MGIRSDDLLTEVIFLMCRLNLINGVLDYFLNRTIFHMAGCSTIGLPGS